MRGSTDKLSFNSIRFIVHYNIEKGNQEYRNEGNQIRAVNL